MKITFEIEIDEDLEKIIEDDEDRAKLITVAAANLARFCNDKVVSGDYNFKKKYRNAFGFSPYISYEIEE